MPLDLQWEDPALVYAYLEMEVCTEGPLLWCRYKSKAKAAIIEEDVSYVRLPHGRDGHTPDERVRYLNNTLRRIIDCCSYEVDAMWSIVFLAIETQKNDWPVKACFLKAGKKLQLFCT